MIEEVRRDREKGRKLLKKRGTETACFTTIILLITFYKVRCSTFILALDIFQVAKVKMKKIILFLFTFALSLSRAQNSLCSVCKCDTQADKVPVLVDCRNSGISSLNLAWEFPQGLQNRADIMYDIDLAGNSLEIITPFPKIPVQKISFKSNKIREIEAGARINSMKIPRLVNNSSNLSSFEL